MINELIEQIGGRERLEAIVYAMGAEPCDADPILESVTHGDIGKMARALLAVLDAQENRTIRKRKALLWLERQQVVHPGMNEVRYAIELITAPPVASAPDGWKLVPLEPTQRMIEAHIEGMVSGGATRAYRAMIAAAPAPGGDHDA